MVKEGSDLRIGPLKIEWLKDFSDEFDKTEPQPDNALARTALLRVFRQGYRDQHSALSPIVIPGNKRRNSAAMSAALSSHSNCSVESIPFCLSSRTRFID